MEIMAMEIMGMEGKPLIVFDMDGVLVEVTESYRAAVITTVRHFTGQTIDNATIQDWKNRGGYNNDWLLTQHLCREAGIEIPYETVIDQFNVFFFGDNGDNGLILREQWVPRDGLLQRLRQRFQLAIFTGRDRREASFTLNRFACEAGFAPVITTDDVVNGKPAPDGLLLIQQQHPGAKMIFVGDTVDDARCAAAAGVPFIGIAATDNPRYTELVDALKANGAIAVLDELNQIEGVLPA